MGAAKTGVKPVPDTQVQSAMYKDLHRRPWTIRDALLIVVGVAICVALAWLYLH